MRGLMQDWPLTVDRILDHAATIHPRGQVVTRRLDGQIHRTDYATIHRRARQVSAALLALGIGLGDRVATLAWNGERHMECWYGAMGIGAVVHTLNPRLHPDQIAWIANHAGGRVLILDATFVPLVEAIHDRLRFEHYVIIGDAGDMPANRLGASPYEEWIADAGGSAVGWGGFDEDSACGLCYTSGTTGDPKGVLYAHRSTVLHSMMVLQKDVFGCGVDDVVMPVVPMFHASAWGLVFACPAAGSKLVLPGQKLDGASLYELLDREKVTFTAAVPTIWLGLLDHLRAEGLKLPHLKRVVIGGAALPEAILRAFEEDYGVQVVPGWGMTETSPLGTMGRVPAELADEPEARIAQQLKQGVPPFGVELKIVDEAGARLPWDGQTPGHLRIRGLAIASGYFGGAGGDVLDEEGFFPTGDVATIDRFGAMKITDRAKDIIKSGGEWISSVDIETIILSHPAVANAAAIGVPHPKWDERPVLVIELRGGHAATPDALRDFLDGRIARWWMPDDVLFVDAIPLGPTGKVDKMRLRETYQAERAVR